MIFLQLKKILFCWENHHLASYVVFKAWMTETKSQSSIHSRQRSEIVLTVQHMWCSKNMISEFSYDEAWEVWASEMSSYEAAFNFWKLFRLKLTLYKDCDDSWKKATLKLKLFSYEDCSMSWEKTTMSLKKAAESCKIMKNFSAKKFFIWSCNDFSSKNISEHMNKTLKFARESLVKTRKQMMKQVNKHRKEVDYKIESKMFLNERNIITARSFKKLNDKILDSFINLDLIDSSYKLKLSESMHVYDVFHSDLLCSVVDDFLSDQKNEFSDSIVINDEDEWKINDILNFRWYRRWLQYRIKWNDYDNDLNWYNADDDEFMNIQKIIDDFHIQYLNKLR